jgi:hypothetical protein
MRMLPILATSVACIAFTTTAHAQQRDSSAGTIAIVKAAPTHAQIIAVFDSLPVRTQTLLAIKDLTAQRVHLVDVTPIIVADSAKLIDSLLTRHAMAITAMRAALDSNTVIVPLFEPLKITSADAVALDVGSDGIVRVYYRKKP